MDQAERLRNIIKANAVSESRPLARVIAVTSGKGGVGKSNTSINLAVQFRKMGKRVIILDADFGLANIEIMFGTVPEHNLCDLIYQGKNIKEVITWGPMDVGFISGGSGIAELSNLSKDHLAFIIRNLSELDSIADIIIVDTGAGISDAVLEFLVASEEVLLVTTPEPTSITDSYSLLKSLDRHPSFSGAGTKVKLVANKVDNHNQGQILYDKLNAVVSRYLELPLSYLGAVPQDSQLSKAAYGMMAEKLMDGEQVFGVPRRGMAAFFSRIISAKNE